MLFFIEHSICFYYDASKLPMIRLSIEVNFVELGTTHNTITYLPSYLPSYLPTYLSTYLPTYLPTYDILKYSKVTFILTKSFTHPFLDRIPIFQSPYHLNLQLLAYNYNMDHYM